MYFHPVLYHENAGVSPSKTLVRKITEKDPGLTALQTEQVFKFGQPVSVNSAAGFERLQALQVR